MAADMKQIIDALKTVAAVTTPGIKTELQAPDDPVNEILPDSFATPAQAGILLPAKSNVPPEVIPYSRWGLNE